MPKKILLVLTGGTICSFADEQTNEQMADVASAKRLIIENFRRGDSRFKSEADVVFDIKTPLNILSENMTAVHMNTLIRALKEYDYSQYDGVIILHGTDTLAYTASLLSILLSGSRIPFILVSAQLPLYEAESNGNANFKCAVELIVGGIAPNVYAVYRNEEISDLGNYYCMYVHLGAHLLQCAERSNNFYSNDMVRLEGDTFEYKGARSKCGDMLLYSVGELSSCILYIKPYVGIDYSFYSLDGVSAVLHGVYHSETACVNPYGDDEVSSHSVLSLKARCDERGIAFFVEPCEDKAYKYETTGMLLRSGAYNVSRMTSEMTYVKLLLGCSLGYLGDELAEFVKREINGERIY